MTNLLVPVVYRLWNHTLRVRKGSLGHHGLKAHVEMLHRDELVFSDDVRVTKNQDRERFIFAATQAVEDLDPDEIREGLIHFGTAVEQQLPQPQRSAGAPYFERDGGMWWNKPTQSGDIPTRLTNFVARIVAEVVENDGLTETRVYEIEAELDGQPKRFAILAQRFERMDWVADNLGASAIIAAGSSLKDRAREAIQQLSDDIEHRSVRVHTGWVETDDGWLYLHAGGGIGRSSERVEVRFDSAVLQTFRLPQPPSGRELAQAVAASLDCLNLGPLPITVPLVASVYRAPLSQAHPVTHATYLDGFSGTFKTELTAIGQAHYGKAFNGKNLPASWTATDNALEKLCFLLKDAIAVVDDFKPVGGRFSVEDLHAKADRVLRAQGNQQGKARMNSDLDFVDAFYPRGLILTSGEEIPQGHSLRARMLILNVAPGDVDKDILTRCQQRAREGVYAQAMAGYLEWLSSRLDDIRGRLPARVAELRSECLSSGASMHARVPDNVASLAAGWEVLLEFAEHSGAIDSKRRAELWSKGWETLLAVGEAQQTEHAEQDEVDRFVSVLRELIESRAVHLAAIDDDVPADPGQWGWRYDGSAWRYGGARLGWTDGRDAFLKPAETYRAVVDATNRDGRRLAMGRDTLYKRLKQRGILASWDQDHTTVRRSVGGDGRPRVLHLAASLLQETGPTGPIGPVEDAA